MLTDLRIRDLAIIQELRIAFSGGLNLLTGETGAGKSIIVEALGLLTGGRADAETVRAGAQSALVEGHFEDVPDDALDRARETGAEPEDGRLLLAREVGAGGRTRAFVDGRSVPVSVLRDIGERLLDLHGQHQNLTLLKAEAHREALDRYAGVDTLLGRTAAACEAVREAASALERAEMVISGREERLDLLRYQQQELAAADLRDGEEESLRSEISRLTHAVRIGELCHGITGDLSEEDGSAMERIGRASEALSELAGLDQGLEPLHGRLAEASYALEDVLAGIRSGLEVEADPDRLETAATRLGLLESLGRKYGGDATHLRGRLQEIETEIESLDGGGGSVERRRRDLDVAARSYLEIASELSAARSRAAVRLSRALTGELRSLAFDRVSVRVNVTARDEEPSPVRRDGVPLAVSPRGYDRVEILFSPNLGEEPRPLERIASGGELSRMMLALNVVTGSRGMAPTVVFDEVDSGIGGRTAGAIGDRLAGLGGDRQILCVTHLPQIACRADSHWRIFKSEEGGRTSVGAEPLDREARVEEIARMLAGRRITEASLRHASELLAAGSRNSRRSGRRTA